MKKIFLSLIFSFSLIQFQAQNPLKRVDVGVKVGLNASRLSTDTISVSSSARVGYNFSAFARLNLTKHLYFEPAVEYYITTPEIITNIGNITTGEIKDKLGIHTLQVPLNLGLKLFKGPLGLFALRIKGGGSGAFILNVDDNKFKLKKGDFNSLNFLANGGIGVDVWHLTVDLDYHSGLTDVLKNFNGKNKMITLAVGLKF